MAVAAAASARQIDLSRGGSTSPGQLAPCSRKNDRPMSVPGGRLTAALQNSGNMISLLSAYLRAAR